MLQLLLDKLNVNQIISNYTTNYKEENKMSGQTENTNDLHRISCQYDMMHFSNHARGACLRPLVVRENDICVEMHGLNKEAAYKPHHEGTS